MSNDAPIERNAFPKLPTTEIRPLICVPNSAGLIARIRFANNEADSPAPSKSSDAICERIKPNALPACSNFEPLAKTFAFSFASFNWSDS